MSLIGTKSGKEFVGAKLINSFLLDAVNRDVLLFEMCAGSGNQEYVAVFRDQLVGVHLWEDVMLVAEIVVVNNQYRFRSSPGRQYCELSDIDDYVCGIIAGLLPPIALVA